MTTITLVYPYFRPINDKSIFRFPPLGLGYIVSYLRQNGVSASLVDCTFVNPEEAVRRVRESTPRLVGIYSMFSMKHPAIQMARLLKNHCDMLVVGGPFPTVCPEDFLEDFDVAVVGEGEVTMLELIRAVEDGRSLSTVNGIVYKKREGNNDPEIVHTQARGFFEDLDALPFPARELFDNQSYRQHYAKNFGYTTTSLITSRGCPFNCDFCSRAVFGNAFRARSAENVVDEVEDVQKLGYERIWFADDCFTLNRKRLLGICDEIIRQEIKIGWECLSRVDTIDEETAQRMKKAGCIRIFFGIESGNENTLIAMKKQINTRQAKNAVSTAKSAGIETGAFFIVGYPGETDSTILDTIRFASSLPLDYLSFTVPYPIPGTPLYERIKGMIEVDDWDEPRYRGLTGHKMIYRSPFSETKLKFAILKGSTQFTLRKKLGTGGYKVLGEPFERITDVIFRILR